MNSEDPYAVAVMCNSSVVGHVLYKMSASCTLFLSHSSLTRVCTKRIMHMDATKTLCFIISEIKYGGCFAICQHTKLKSSPNFPAIQ